ncbi:MAG: transporter [Sulfurimonas sp.]|nr:MAG: transporter [Sulfurimonas sp.]
MRALSALSVLLLLCSSLNAAQEADFEGFLSKLKEQEFTYDYQKSSAQSLQLRDSWIQPIIVRYSYKKSNPYDATQTVQNAAIILDQPIFQSGGIYFAIKYAEASRIYSNYSIDVAKRKLIKDVIALLMQIQKSELLIQRHHLQIANATINLEQKKELYMNGQLDSGFLDSAVIDRNTLTQALYDLETSKEQLISSFKALSDLDYIHAKVPHLELVHEDAFMEHSIDLKKIRSENEKNRYFKNMTIAKYLPKLSITAGYNWDSLENPSFAGSAIPSPPDTSYYNYGFKLSMPLDINFQRDIESVRIDYLKSLVVLENTKRSLVALYHRVEQNLRNYDKKIALAKANATLYEKLYTDTISLFKAGYKTQYDVDLLQNSMQIQSLDARIFEMDKQLELLNLYEKMMNAV